MIDFSTLQGLTIPEGVVTQIADASGNVLWSAGWEGTFKVAKITSNTYANETTYSSEEFILLNIYPKTNGTVYVNYEGVTKTIKDTSGAEEPNAQQVFFGTFNGVSDEVETPSSGILTITGDCRGAGGSSFNIAKAQTSYSKCITAVGDLSGMEIIPEYAFYECPKIAKCEIPASVTSIGQRAFACSFGIPRLTKITIPASVTSIGGSAFYISSAAEISRTVTMLSHTPATLGDTGVFDSIGKNNIIVPVGSGDTYKAAENWSIYADYITEASA